MNAPPENFQLILEAFTHRGEAEVEEILQDFLETDAGSLVEVFYRLGFDVVYKPGEAVTAVIIFPLSRTNGSSPSAAPASTPS